MAIMFIYYKYNVFVKKNLFLIKINQIPRLSEIPMGFSNQRNITVGLIIIIKTKINDTGATKMYLY